jgi:hypothetical protein
VSDPKWTESEMLRVLHHQYQTKMVNAVVPHAPLGLAGSEVGFHRSEKAATIRYVDALVLFRDKRWAIEIKVSASDLRRELANPDKVVLWRDHTNAFYYFVPPELAPIALAEVPKSAGVMTVEGGFFTKILRRSPINREPLELPYDTWRRISRRHGRNVLGGAA